MTKYSRANERVVCFFKRSKGSLVDVDLRKLLIGPLKVQELPITTLYKAHRYELSCPEEMLPVLRAMARKSNLEVLALIEQVTFSPYSKEDKIPFCAVEKSPVITPSDQKPCARIFLNVIDNQLSVCLINGDLPPHLFRELNQEFDFCLFLDRWQVGSFFDGMYIVWTHRESYENTAINAVTNIVKSTVRDVHIQTIFKGQ